MNTEIEELIREAVDETDLRGLDYLTEKQAARYAGVSVSAFRERAHLYGIHPARFMGKKLYRKTDIQRAIEHSWQPWDSAAGIGYSGGKMRGGATGNR